MWTEEKELDNVGIKRCDELAEKLINLRIRRDEIEEDLKRNSEESRGLEQEIERILESHSKNSWKCQTGTIELRTRTSVRTPKDEESKRLLFTYLQNKGVFWQLVNINSQSLNALYKTELETAQQEGKDFSLPGISEPTISTQIVVRKK